MKSKKSKFVFLFLSLIIFFIPLMLLISAWFTNGSVIVGHDSGFSLNAIDDLHKKSFTWWEDNFGIDGTYYISSQFIHAIDLVSAKLAGIAGGGNGYVVFFWFSMMFLAMFPLSFYLANKLNRPYIIFLFPVFFVINFYIFQSIFIFERTKYSLLVSLPIFLFFCFLVRDKKIPILIAAIGTSLTMFIFNGGGWAGIPLYGSIVLTGLTFSIFILTESILTKRFDLLKRIIVFFSLSIVLLILLDAYSFFPAIYTQMFSNDSPVANIRTDQTWIGMISVGASFINLFRMQGIPDWYSSANMVNPKHPYAALYTTNSLLIFLSFLIPVIAFLSLLFVRNSNEKRYVYFFALLMLIGMAFTSGSHPPLGSIFIFLYDHIPFFWIFRSPFFKFAPAYLLGLAFLLSFSFLFIISKVTSRIQNQSRQKYFFIGLLLLVVVSWYSFHFAFFNKNIFSPWEKGFSTLVEVPLYVRDFEKWVKGREVDDNARILLLPPINNQWGADAYKWGYWSLSPLPQFLTNKAIVVNDTSLKENESQILSLLYGKIQEGNEKEVENIASALGISYFLVRGDAVFGSSKDIVSTFDYGKQLASMSNIHLLKSFDKWKIYTLTTAPKTKIYAINSLSLTDEISDYFNLGKDTSYQFIKKEDTKNVFSKLSPFVTYDIQRFQCISCENKNGLADKEKLSKKDWQIFHFSIPTADLYDIYIDIGTLPRSGNGEILYPEKIIFTNKQKGSQEEFNFLEKNVQKVDGKNLVGFSEYFDVGEYDGLFIFPKLTNLLPVTKSVTVNINGHERFCIGGNVSLFSPQRLYTLTFARQQENQTGTLLFVEGDKQGEYVLPDSVATPRTFTYTYTPLKDSKTSSIFVCGFSFIPGISNLLLTDKLEPRTFLVTSKAKSMLTINSLPAVTFKKINPTQYAIHIGQSEKSFILVFNERFNKFWKLLDIPSVNDSHFQINGFANGWIFDKSDGYNLVLEYLPQQKVYQGEPITVVTFIILGTYFSYWFWKQKKT